MDEKRMETLGLQLEEWMDDEDLLPGEALDVIQRFCENAATSWEIIRDDPDLLDGLLTGEQCNERYQGWDKLNEMMKKVRL
jgi:hypothetical protein